MSSAGTIIGAVLDLFDSKKEYSKSDRQVFGLLYRIKAACGITSAAATLLTTFTYAAPLLKRRGQVAAGQAATKLGTAATNIVMRRVLFMSIGGWVTAATFTVQLLIIVLDEDALQKWCARSAFGIDFEKDPYGNGAKQVEAFHSALSEVSSTLFGFQG